MPYGGTPTPVPAFSTPTIPSMAVVEGSVPDPSAVPSVCPTQPASSRTQWGGHVAPCLRTEEPQPGALRFRRLASWQWDGAVMNHSVQWRRQQHLPHWATVIRCHNTLTISTPSHEWHVPHEWQTVLLGKAALGRLSCWRPCTLIRYTLRRRDASPAATHKLCDLFASLSSSSKGYLRIR